VILSFLSAFDSRPECLVEVCNKILAILKTNTNPDKIVSDAKRKALTLLDRGVRHQIRQLCQALIASKGFRQGDHLERGEEDLAVLQGPFDVEGEHPRVAKLLPLHQLTLRVAGKTRAPDGDHGRVVFQEPTDSHGVALVLLHPHPQCLQRPVHQVAVERAGDGAYGVLEKLQAVIKTAVVEANSAHYDVGVPIHVLCQTVIGDVRTQLQGPLEVGGLEGVVHHKEKYFASA